MISTMRTKFGPAIVGTIIGSIALVFIFSGVFSPKATRGIHEGSVAGEVNGDKISLSEFNRELNRRTEFFRNMSGGKFSDAQMKAFRIKEGVFSELVNRKLMEQAAEKAGLEASDDEVKKKITEIPAFQKEGKFDSLTYKNVLQANNYQPSQFEKMMRDDLSVQRWNQYFHDRVKVSEDEIKDEFMKTRNKRNIKYVLLTSEAGRKGVQVSPDEIQKFLADPAKVNLAKARFDQNKDTTYKGKTFEQVKTDAARELIAGDKTEEVKKANQQLAQKVLPLLTAEKSSDAKVNAVLKPFGAAVKETKPITQETPYLPGIGEARELMTDAFAEKSPIDPKQGGKAKLYTSAGWALVAVVSEAQRPELAALEKDRKELVAGLINKKERTLMEAELKKLNGKAKIVRNEAIVGDAEQDDGGGNPGGGGALNGT
ncbi:MAG: SurA N-terminal domain-containing protein [Methylotenera sp.]|nr:SurA N-terminal domain-containing protein [Oligoflexia bacterium]